MTVLLTLTVILGVLLTVLSAGVMLIAERAEPEPKPVRVPTGANRRS